MTMYFWLGGEVCEEPPLSESDLEKPQYRRYNRMYCVDSDIHSTYQHRYGTFVKRNSQYPKKYQFYRWQSIPFSDFPPKFKAHLLLLGIS